MSESIWTDDKIQQAKDLQFIGMTGAAIANALGPDFTRNCVIGKLNRLGIKSKDRPAHEQPREKFRAERVPHVNKITLPPIAKPSDQYRWGFRPRAEPTVSIPAPTTAHVTLMERTGCAWPTNDGRPYLFCDASTDGHGSYCPHHRERMYVRAR